MSVTGASVALESEVSEVHEKGALTRAWRPFPAEVADILCVENAHEDVAPRMHDRLSMTVVRTAAVVRCESTRSLVAAPSCVLLVPALQLYSLRAQGRPAGGSVTLLVGASHLAGLGATDRAGLVTDVTLVEQVEALVAQLSRPVRSVECATAIGALLERLTSIGAARTSASPQTTSLGRVRDYLRDNPGEPVTIADLAGLAALTESHLIRAFHREFGLPPHAYHLRRRLAAASELLASGLSVSTVAYECGFADQSHLSRKFKEVYGLTPAAWATAVATGTRRKAPTKVVSIGIPRRETYVARAISW
jgi:AraC-like DNA-binding protein